MIKICDNGEKLVEVEKSCPGIVLRAGQSGKIYVRQTVAKKLNQAKKYLPKDVTFVINSAWRSKESQKKIYHDAIKGFAKEYPKLNKKQVLKIADQFVDPYSGPIVSGHLTGGAIDIRLSKNGRNLPIRSRKLSYKEDYQSIQPKLSKYIQKNREILRTALTKAGFQNHPKEFWHWSYGDYWWAKRMKKKIAIYGPVDKI